VANLILIFGPPASGKAAIGTALSELTNYRLFHNHMTADAGAAIFGWGTPECSEAVQDIRLSLLSRAAEMKDLPNIIFTFVWAFGIAEDDGFIGKLVEAFESKGEKVYFVELLASLEARLAREGTALRVALKPSKRNVELSRAQHADYEGKYTLNSQGKFPYSERHLIIDTEKQIALESARQICRHYGFVQQG
jgi:hypothetical protein